MSEQPQCPICRADSVRRLRWRMGYSIHECLGCGLLFSTPLPSPRELDEFYQGYLHKKPEPKEIAERTAARRAEIEDLFGGGDGAGRRFLDHGGGVGVAFRAATDLGYDAYLNELDAAAVEFAKTNLSLDDAHFIADMTTVRQGFDCIFSDNVIEHVTDPVGLLRQLTNLLRPGGTLVIKTPNAKSAETLFYPYTLAGYMRTALAQNAPLDALLSPIRGPVWSCDPPRHLYSFTPMSLREMAKLVGVSDGNCEVMFYRRPLLDASFTRLVLRKPKSARAAVTHTVAAALTPVELSLKAVQWSLSRMNAVSASGLILRIRRGA